MASIRDTLANLVEQYKAGDTPLANLMRGDTEGAKQSAANAFEGMTKDPYAGLNVATPVGIAGTFIGKSSPLWNQEAHKLAQALETQKMSPKDIWAKTGTGRGLDKEWRQEISDHQAYYDPYGKSTLSGQYIHPELYKAYPDLANLEVKTVVDPTIDEVAGSLFVNPKKLTPAEQLLRIKLTAPNNREMTRGLAHEGQHGVQTLANLNAGGSPERALEIANSRNMNEFFNSPDIEDNAYNAYRHQAGEAEARLTENRLSLNPEQRRKYFPFEYNPNTTPRRMEDEFLRNAPEHAYALDIRPEYSIVHKLSDLLKNK
jgi:hypothetical protein